jgi:adenine-specific DNA methylase
MQEKYLPDHLRWYIHSRRRDDTAQNDGEEEGNEEEKEDEADVEVEEEAEEEAEEEEITYTISMEDRDSTGECPKCSTRIKDRYGMRRHFTHWHLYDKIIIEEEDARAVACSGVCYSQAHQRRTKTCTVGTTRKDQTNETCEKRTESSTTGQIQDRRGKRSKRYGTSNTSDGSPVTMTTTTTYQQ